MEIADWDDDEDEGYSIRNISKHVSLGKYSGNEGDSCDKTCMELGRNGLLHYESDVRHGCDWIK